MHQVQSAGCRAQGAKRTCGGAIVTRLDGATVRGWRLLTAIVVLLLAVGCSQPPPAKTAAPAAPANDPQHAGITTPHGDHSAHHGGMVLMNGEVHYEVVFDPAGHHRLYFTDAVREDLPASMAKDVVMVVTRPGAPDERIALTIDDSGESWEARGRPVAGDDVTVKLTYMAQGAPFEIEIPFVPAKAR